MSSTLPWKGEAHKVIVSKYEPHVVEWLLRWDYRYLSESLVGYF